jgi:hypothetical protein
MQFIPRFVKSLFSYYISIFTYVSKVFLPLSYSQCVWDLSYSKFVYSSRFKVSSAPPAIADTKKPGPTAIKNQLHVEYKQEHFVLEMQKLSPTIIVSLL